MTVVLLTGAAGTIGSQLRHALAERHPEIEVLGLDLRGAPGVAAVPVSGPFPPWFRAALPKVTHLVHLAAEVSTGVAPADGCWTQLAGQVAALKVLAESLPALRHAVFSSSYMVYAVPPPNPVAEDSPVWPINAYAWVKCALETFLNTLPVSVCCLRFTGVYGPGVPLDLGRAVTEVLRALAENVPVTLHLPGTARRNHLYLDDAVEALRRALTEHWTGTFNVAGPDVVSVRDMVDILTDLAGRPVPARWVNGPPGWDAVVDTRLLADQYGFYPRTGIRNGLQAYHDWAQNLKGVRRQ